MKNTRKKNLVFAVILMLVMSLFVITVNAEEIEISYDNDMDSIIVRTDDDSRESAFAAYAEYDDDGVLIALKTEEIPFVSGKAMMSVEVCSLNNKVFVWDDMNIAQAPIGDVYSINNTSQDTGTETENPIAVYLEQYMCMSNGEECIEIEAYANGEKVNLLIEEGSQAEDFISYNGFEYEGIPFTYTLSEEGFVDEIFPIFSEDYLFELSSFNELLDVSFDAANSDANGSFDALLNPQIDTLFDNKATGDDTEFYFGPVMNKTPQTITLAQMNKGENLTNTDQLKDFDFGKDINVYGYDYTNSKHMVSKTDKGAIVKTFIPKIAYDDEDKTIVDWTVEESKECVFFALLKEVNRDIVDVYFFVYPDYEISDTDMITASSVELKKSEIDIDLTAKLQYGCIYFYEDEKMKGCELSQVVEFSVNGVVLTDIDEIEYVLENTNGNIYLSDLDADGVYDKVDIEYIGTAIVDSVIDGRIYFDNYTYELSTTLELSDDVEYSITLDDEEISLEDIQPGDVLSIAYDYYEGFRYSPFYYIEVSRETVFGEVTKYNDAYVTVNDKEYEINSDLLGMWSGNFDKYLLKLDSYGLIAEYSVVVDASNYAILENVFENYLGEHYVVIVDSNGDSHEYEIKNQSDVYEIENILYEDVNGKIKREYQYRVVEYALNQAGKIIIKENVYPKEASGRYRSYRGMVGTAAIGETSKLIDMSLYSLDSEYYPVEVTELEENVDYTTYCYAKNSDGSYAFVLIESDGGIYRESPAQFDAYMVLSDVYYKWGTYYVEVMGLDGTYKRYVLNNQSDEEVQKIRDYIYDSTEKLPIEERIYNCAIASNKYITVCEQSVGEENLSAAYNGDTNIFGEIALTDDILILKSYIVNSTSGNYESIYNISALNLDEEIKYITHAFKNDGGEYEFILITGDNQHNSNLMAIYSSQGNVTDEMIGETISIKTYTDGDEKYLILDTACEMPDMTEGIPFVYEINDDGYVTEITPVFTEDVCASISEYTDFRTNVFDIANADGNGSFDGVIESQLQTMLDTEREDVEFYFGPIVDKSSYYVMLAKINEGTNLTNIDSLIDHTLMAEPNVYVYDYGAVKSGYKVSVGGVGSIVRTPVVKPAYADEDKTIINWAHETLADSVNFALVKEVNRDVTEVVVYHAAY